MKNFINKKSLSYLRMSSFFLFSSCGVNQFGGPANSSINSSVADTFSRGFAIAEQMPASYTLTINFPNNGYGFVDIMNVSQGGGANSCEYGGASSSCTLSFPAGTTIKLLPSTDGTSFFSGFAGTNCSYNPSILSDVSTCSFSLNSNLVVDAVFRPRPATPIAFSISNVAISNLTHTSATITWTTSADADARLRFGPTSQLGTHTSLNNNLIRNQSITLNNLNPNTTYYFRALSRDLSGYSASSLLLNFKTAKIPTAVLSATCTLDPKGLEATVKVNPISGEPIMAYGSDSSEWQVGIDGNNYFTFSPLTHSTISGVSFNIVQGTESTEVTCPAFAPPAISCEQNYFDLTNWGAETIRNRCTTSGVVENVQIQGYGWIETTDNPNEFYYNLGAMPYCGDYQNEVIAEGMGHQASFDINTHIDCNARIDSTEQLCPQGLVFNGSYCGEAIDYGNIIVPFVPGQAGELEFPVTKFSDKVKLTGGSAPNGFKISCAEDSCKVSWTGSESWSDRIYVNYVIEDYSGNQTEGSREEYLFLR